MDAVFTIFAVLLFTAVILLVEGAWLWWSGRHGSAAERIRQRLQIMSHTGPSGTERVSILKQRRYAASDQLDAWLKKSPGCGQLDKLLMQSGLTWNVARVLSGSVAAALLAMLLIQPFAPPLPAVVVAMLLFAAVPLSLVLRARRWRLKKIEEQLPEAADFIARALRAGHSFTNVLQMVGAEMPDPLAGEFRAAHEEINYGVPMNEALHNLAARVPITDLRYLVIAVLIQRESGGNLAEILANIGHIIRERLKLLAQVRVLSAEGRMSAWVLGLLPFFVIGVMSIMNPRYISVLWLDATGVRLLWASLGMILLGVLWLRRVIHIRV
ncbi:type II secretion system F family protein [Massilia arenosa]|uniref:Type II secretion system F family protein n=1 Tax=Zemynaea arenosa TaxID=2561931 RepID=A0A4Y9SBW5_9BURK|nr:type II secretion system F family protein [Massilia arenosa]TFW17148.1 type II secretion system F family protein [Massilia arenosa]